VLKPDLQPRVASEGTIEAIGEGAWRLSIPAGPAGNYRLAQLDDYSHLHRAAFDWLPPFGLTLRARVSHADLPGTWGFGLWNDPFNARMGLGGTRHQFLALPNAAWFFWASPPNYLAVHDNHPTQGFLAATFSSHAIPPAMLALSAPLLPFLAWPSTARMLRHMARGFVRDDAAQLALDPTAWHTYELAWQREKVSFTVDGTPVAETAVAPHGRMGLVLWIDNQYAAFPPHGRLRFGRLPNPEPAWLELADIAVTPR